MPGLNEEVIRKEGEVAFQPVAGSEQRLLEPGQRLPQCFEVSWVGRIERGEEFLGGFGGSGAVTGQSKEKRKSRIVRF